MTPAGRTSLRSTWPDAGSRNCTVHSDAAPGVLVAGRSPADRSRLMGRPARTAASCPPAQWGVERGPRFPRDEAAASVPVVHWALQPLRETGGGITGFAEERQRWVAVLRVPAARPPAACTAELSSFEMLSNCNVQWKRASDKLDFLPVLLYTFPNCQSRAIGD